MRIPQSGGCLCGRVRYEITEAPRLAYTCHCRDCQRLTSSAFSMAIVVSEASFRVTTGEPRPIESRADSGRIKARWVCPDCGCWVYSSSVPDNGIRRVRAGSLDDPSWVRPTAHFWTRSRLPWVTLPEGDEAWEKQPAG
jgi:hypothetical protein